MRTKATLFRAVYCAALASFLASCSSDEKEPDCVPAPVADSAKKPKIVSTPLFIDDQAGKKDNDWCRACVMGNKGYASCQRIYGDTPTEARDAIKERARIKACVDSGYTAENCPPTAMIGMVCKGDPPPANAPAPGAILQDLYRSLNPGGAVPPKTAGANSAATQSASGAEKRPAVE